MFLRIDEVTVINTDKVLYVYAQGDEVCVHLEDGQVFTVKFVTAYSESLPDDNPQQHMLAAIAEKVNSHAENCDVPQLNDRY